MKYFVQVEVMIEEADSHEEAARNALEQFRGEEFSMTVGTLTGAQEEVNFDTTEIEQN